MKIADSSVNMESVRNYRQIGHKSSVSTGSESFTGIAGSLYESKRDSYLSGGNAGPSYGGYSNTGADIAYGGFGGLKSGNILANGIEANGINGLETMQKSLAAQILSRFGASGRQTQNGMLTQRWVTYQEYEQTDFQATGRATTQDGRVIDFNVGISMGRGLMEYMDIQIPMLQNALMDPLVVNVGANVTHLKDQSFRFDLNADGTAEEISMPSEGSGFLALDRNEDGIINDGSELFGTRSGDGFGDLRKYDNDGNGWIDENDEIFAKLKVWCKGENGEDILLDLKQADIGAIYLGEASTEFTLKGSGGTNGVIRSTGVFLKESGGVGTIQHVDLAVKKAQTPELSLEQAYGKKAKEPAGAITVTNIGGSDGRSGNRSRSIQESRERENAKALRTARRRSEQEFRKRLADARHARKQIVEEFQEKRREEDARIEKLFEDREEFEARKEDAPGGPLEILSES